jgi:restriction endonuclease Mrr
MKNTVEERIYEILERKGILHEEVIDSLSEADFKESLTVDDLLEALEINRETVKFAAPKAVGKERLNIAEIYNYLPGTNPEVFEHIVKDVFQQAHQYYNARVTKRSADGGVDIEATGSIPGGIQRIVIQCKRTAKVGPECARELLGVVASDRSIGLGFLVTSGRFTRSCRQFAERQGQIKLIDGIQLAKWIHEYNIAIRETVE